MPTDPRQTGPSRVDPENPNRDLTEEDARRSQRLGQSVGKTPGTAEGEEEEKRRDKPYPNEPGKTPG